MKYRALWTSNGQQQSKVIEAENPRDAVLKVVPKGSDLIKVNKADAQIIVDLLNGERKSISYYKIIGNGQVQPIKANNLEWKLLSARKYSDGYRFKVANVKTGQIMDISKAKVTTLARKQGVEGIILLDDKIYDIKPVDLATLRIDTPTVPYEVIKFFNRLCLELADIPEQVRKLVESVNNNTKFVAAGFSKGDYARGLAKDYEAIRQYLSPKDFKAVYEGKPESNIYVKVFNEYLNKTIEKRKGGYDYQIDESYYDKLLKITGMPQWFKPEMKEDLYCLG